MRALFEGSGVALVTPFTPDDVDYDTLGQLIDWQMAEGTDALIVCGTTGEPSTMTDREREGVIAFAISRVAGRIPVIAGVGHNDTRRTLERAHRAQDLGADGLLVVTPYYNKATQLGLLRHFCAVMDEVALPLIAYNVPSRTGLNMAPETAAMLAAHPQFAGLKEANADSAHLLEVARRLEGRAPLYAGNDAQVLQVMALGGSGVISVAANVAPRALHDMTADFLRGDIDACRRAQFHLAELFSLLFCEVSPIPVKYALKQMGFGDGRVRSPLTPLAPQWERPLDDCLRALGLIK